MDDFTEVGVKNLKKVLKKGKIKVGSAQPLHAGQKVTICELPLKDVHGFATTTVATAKIVKKSKKNKLYIKPV